MSQTVSMFSVPVFCPSAPHYERLYAIVPQPATKAFDRLCQDDPIWRKGEQGGVRFEKSWTIDDDHCRVRLRDKLRAWLA